MKITTSTKTNLALASVLFIAVSLISCSSTLYTLGDFDENGDGTLNQSEFNEVIDTAGYFNYWDADDNGQISEDEWNQGGVGTFNTKYDADDRGSWNTWDLNNDDSLSEDEFNNGVFNTIDDNETAQIEEAEFNLWYDDDLF